MCTGGEYRGVRHDLHFSAASSFQIGVSRGRRMASSRRLARVSQRLHITSSQPEDKSLQQDIEEAQMIPYEDGA